MPPSPGVVPVPGTRSRNSDIATRGKGDLLVPNENEQNIDPLETVGSSGLPFKNNGTKDERCQNR